MGTRVGDKTRMLLFGDKTRMLLFGDKAAVVGDKDTVVWGQG